MTIGKEDAEHRVTRDPATGIIHVDASIFLAPEDLDLILDRLAHLVNIAHAKRERALVMVSFGTSGAKMGDTVERVRQRSASIYAPDDRLAIVLQSSLLKLQIGRVERIAETRIFASLAEAEAWLASSPASTGATG